MLRFLSLLILLASPWPSQAATLEVRGKLTDAQGQPQGGSCLLRFALSIPGAQPAETWSDSLYIPIEDGLFHFTLGKERAIPPEALKDGVELTVEAPKGTGWKALASPVIPPAAPPAPAAAQKPTPKKDDETARLRARVEALERQLKPQQEPERRARIYEVKPGDTLQTVAAKLWGDASRWSELYSANADRIQRGGELAPGQKLVVPEVEARP